MAGSARGLAFLIFFGLIAAASSSKAALAADDACQVGGAGCAVSALQTKSRMGSVLSHDVASGRGHHAFHDPTPFLKAIANRLRTTPDKLRSTLVQVRNDTKDLTILGNIDKPDDDPIWLEVRADIQQILRSLGPDQEEWMSYCPRYGEKNYEAFANKSCSFEAGMVTGMPIDAFYCGNQKSNIDWSASPFNGKPISDFCNAKVGTAYDPDGVCGRYTDKELLVNILTTVELWYADARNANIMSIDCLMDIADCDIYYCQTCPGRCD